VLTERGAASVVGDAASCAATSGQLVASLTLVAEVAQWPAELQLAGTHATLQCPPSCRCESDDTGARSVGPDASATCWACDASAPAMCAPAAACAPLGSSGHAPTAFTNASCSRSSWAATAVRRRRCRKRRMEGV